MTIAFRTAVYYSPPTPMGLVAGRFVVTHTCRHCLLVVPADLLVEHAKAHGAGPDAGSEPAGQA